MTGIAIFTKVPAPGKSMSRLAASIGNDAAARLHLAFLKDTIVTAKRHGRARLFVTEVNPIFERLCAQFEIEQHLQIEGDLGARMIAAIDALLLDHERAIVVGSDAPLLGDAHFQEANTCAALAFSPTSDGGFALVSATKRPDFSSVPWSSSDTLQRTLDKNPHGERLTSTFDVDAADDLERLVGALTQEPTLAPHTHRALLELGLVEPVRSAPRKALSAATQEVIVERHVRPSECASRSESRDLVAVEAPLTIRIQGENFVTTMRSPGDDEALVLGLLRGEGLIESPDDVARLSPCAPDTIDVLPAGGFAFDLDQVRRRRGTLTTSSCGVCGREQIDDLIASLGSIRPNRALSRSTLPVVHALRTRLQQAQTLFKPTGATHAAGLFDQDGSLAGLGEDIGRHNAADKAVGHWMLNHDTQSRPAVLVVSGRASFEMVQKAARIGAGVLASQKGVTSMAIESARKAGLVLVGFLSDTRFNVYT